MFSKATLGRAWGALWCEATGKCLRATKLGGLRETSKGVHLGVKADAFSLGGAPMRTAKAWRQEFFFFFSFPSKRRCLGKWCFFPPFPSKRQRFLHILWWLDGFYGLLNFYPNEDLAALSLHRRSKKKLLQYCSSSYFHCLCSIR